MRIFSGIQPSGNLHVGNYVGAISQWIELQEGNEAIFCIVDLHAITVKQDPKVLREKTLEVAALYVAAGVDPAKSHIFVQSENSDHPYMAWLLNCVAPYGQMMRMTQFKEKSEKQKEATTVGLFDYPALMAADILLYQTDEVPVGDDQVQHIELTRDLAEKFNTTYSNVFNLPKVRLIETKTRVMSLLDPMSKMSKSDGNARATIFLLDDTDSVAEKIRRAVTDSGEEIVYREDKPAMSNLLSIFSVFSSKSISELEKTYTGASYKQFKDDLAEAAIAFLTPLQRRYTEIRTNSDELEKILSEGADYAKSISSKTLAQACEVMGLSR